MLVVGVNVLGLAWQQIDVDTSAPSAHQWVADRWMLLEASVNDLVDQLYIRCYDRRAPAPTPPPATEGGRP